MVPRKLWVFALLLGVLVGSPLSVSVSPKPPAEELLGILTGVNDTLKNAREQIETELIPTLEGLLPHFTWRVTPALVQIPFVGTAIKDVPLDPEIKSRLKQLGVNFDPPERIFEGPNENRIFALVKQDPPEPSLGVGLDPWSGTLKGRPNPQADLGRPYTKVYDVFNGEKESSGKRARVAQLKVIITFVQEGGGPQEPEEPPGSGQAILTVRSTTTDGRFFEGVPIEYAIEGDQARRGETTLRIRVPKGKHVRLKALNTNAFRFQRWQGAQAGTNPITTPPLNANTSAVAVYERLIPTEDEVTLTIKSARTDKIPYEISGVKGFEIQVFTGNLSCNQSATPIICQVTKEAELRVTAPGSASVCIDPPLCTQNIAFPFFAWKESPPSFPPSAENDITTQTIKMDNDKTWTAWFRPPTPGENPPPPDSVPLPPPNTVLSAAAQFPTPQDALLMVQGINALLGQGLDGFDRVLGPEFEVPEAVRDPLDDSREATAQAITKLEELGSQLKVEIQEHDGESVSIEVKDELIELAAQAIVSVGIAIQEKERGETVLRESFQTKIIGFKFHDLDADGRWEPGETGLKGWGISLIGPLGSPKSALQTANTDKNGRFEFTVSQAGTYLVGEEIREGWAFTTPRKVEVKVRLLTSETVQEILFGNSNGDLTITGIRPIQVVWNPDLPDTSAPTLVHEKNTVFEVTVESTFQVDLETDLKVEFEPGAWRFSRQPYTATVPIKPGRNVLFPLPQAADLPLEPNPLLTIRSAPRPLKLPKSGITVAIDPDNEIIEANETNNRSSGGWDVRKAGRLHLQFFGITLQGLPGPDLNTRTGHAFAQGSSEFVLGTYPVADGKVRWVVYPGTLRIRKVRITKNCKDSKGNSLNVAGNRTIAELRTFGQPPSNLIRTNECVANQVWSSINDQLRTSGWISNIQERRISENIWDHTIGVYRAGWDNEFATGPWGGGFAPLGAQGAFFVESDFFDATAHEMAHTFGLDHPEDATGKQTSLAARGYWVNNLTRIDPGWDFMGIPVSPRGQNPPRAGAGGPNERASWIEDDNFNSLFKGLRNRADPEILVIRGIAQRAGAVELLPWYKLAVGFADLSSGSSGGYAILLLDEKGQVLDRFGFDLAFELGHPPLPLEFQDFAFRIPLAENTHEVQIRGGQTGQILARRTISANPPSVRLLAPPGGESVTAGSELPIVWEGSDPDGDPLSYDLFFSSDGGGNWFPLARDLEDQGFTWDTTGFPIGDEYLIAVLATDGVHVAMDTSASHFALRLKD